MVDLNLLSFYSELNYMKRSDTFGSTQITYGSAGTDSIVTIGHNLGYDPFFVVGVELFGDGIIWSNSYVHELTESSIGGIDIPPSLYYWCTDSALTISLRNGFGTGVQTGTVNVYYGVYLDYA